MGRGLSTRAVALAAVDLKDPKAVEDHIQRLRELDKSFTPPLRAGKSLAQPLPAGLAGQLLPWQRARTCGELLCDKIEQNAIFCDGSWVRKRMLQAE